MLQTNTRRLRLQESQEKGKCHIPSDIIKKRNKLHLYSIRKEPQDRPSHNEVHQMKFKVWIIESEPALKVIVENLPTSERYCE